MRGTMDRIKSVGDSDPLLAINMLDSVQGELENGGEYTRMKGMLLRMRLNDKAYMVPQSDDSAKAVVSYFEGNGACADLQEAYYYAASVYRDLNDSPRALEYFLKSEAVAEGCDERVDSLMLRNTYSHLFLLYYSAQDYHSALEKAKKEYGVARSIGKVTINSITHMADSHLALQNYQEADSVVRIMENYIDWKSPIDVYGLLSFYSRLKKTEQANRVLKIIRENSLQPDAMGYKALAGYYLLVGNIDSAIVCYENIANGDYGMENIYDAARFLFDLYQIKGDEKKSIKSSKLFMLYSDTLDFGKRQEMLADVKNQFLYYKDKAEDEQVKKEKERYRDLALMLVVVVLLTTTVLLSLYFYKKSRYLSKLAVVSDSLSLVRIEKERLEKEAMETEDYLERMKDSLGKKETELSEVKRDLYKIEAELIIKEELLSAKQAENKRFSTLLHKAELEEEASEVIASIRKAAEGKQIFSDAEWQRVYSAIDQLQPDLMEKIVHHLGRFKEKHKQICYLMSIGLTNTQIENLTGLPHASVWRWTKKIDWL